MEYQPEQHDDVLRTLVDERVPENRMPDRLKALGVVIGWRKVKEHLVRLGLAEPTKPRAQPSAHVPTGIQESTDPLEFHPLADIFPLLEGQAYHDLTEDMRQYGQREPIWLYEGQILDGRNRYRACQELSQPCLVRSYQGDQPLAFIVSLNLQRRHLTDSQRAMIGARLATMRQGERTDLTENSVRLSQGQAAELMQVSIDSVQFAKTVQEQGAPEVVSAVEAGEVPVSAAATLAKEDPETQREVVQELKSGRQRSVRSALQAKRSRRTQEPPTRTVQAFQAATPAPIVEPSLLEPSAHGSPRSPAQQPRRMRVQDALVRLLESVDDTHAWPILQELAGGLQELADTPETPVPLAEALNTGIAAVLNDFPAPPKRRRRLSREARWQDAVETLQDLQSEYQDWLDSMPENLQASRVAEMLYEITCIDLSELDNVEHPKGFGRD